MEDGRKEGEWDGRWEGGCVCVMRKEAWALPSELGGLSHEVNTMIIAHGRGQELQARLRTRSLQFSHECRCQPPRVGRG